MKKIVIILSVMLFMFSCDTNKEPKNNTPENDNQTTEHKDSLTNEVLEGILSPVEIAAIIKDKDIPYSEDFILSHTIVERVKNEDRKALLLGMLSVDLAYLNLNRQIKKHFENLKTIHRISNELDADLNFNFQVLKDMVSDKLSDQALNFILVENYHNINNHFLQKDRRDLSIALVTGAWIESLYLACRVNKQSDNILLRDRIAEQKEILISLNSTIEKHKDVEFFRLLFDDLKSLEKAYQPVSISFSDGVTQIIKADDGSQLITQGDSTVTTVSDAQLNEIIRLTEQIRNGR